MSEQKTLSAIQKATAHYKTQLGDSLKSFYVPEWDLTIYFRTIQNLRSESEVVELAQKGKTTEALVMTIINKSRDKDGKLLFSKHDKDTFMNEVDPSVILWVSQQLNKVDLPTIEEVEKNLEETQNSVG